MGSGVSLEGSRERESFFPIFTYLCEVKKKKKKKKNDTLSPYF
jgi:hypothetical protein